MNYPAGTKPGDIENNGITFIRNLAKENYEKNGANVVFSQHAIRQMNARSIMHDDIIRCMTEGYFIQFRPANTLRRGKHPRIIFYDGHETEIYSVSTFEIPENLKTTVITSCLVDWSKWKKVKDYIERK